MTREHEPGCPYEDLSMDELRGVRVTVNLVPNAVRALKQTKKLGYSNTDVINRALTVYAFMEEVTARGGSIYIQEEGDAELRRVLML
jgi:hypothetical protein